MDLRTAPPLALQVTLAKLCNALKPDLEVSSAQRAGDRLFRQSVAHDFAPVAGGVGHAQLAPALPFPQLPIMGDNSQSVKGNRRPATKGMRRALYTKANPRFYLTSATVAWDSSLAVLALH